MSADRLRKVAAEMREYAEAATPGRWIAAEQTHGKFVGLQSPHVAFGAVFKAPDAESTARHIAAWSPPVALAVADLLDAEAAFFRPGMVRADDALALCDAWEGK